MIPFFRRGSLLLVLAFGIWPIIAQEPPPRPNIVLIMVDDMGWSNIGCYGGLVETPHLDGLAKNGVRFNQFYNAARCCPTRASLMTGLHPHQAGVGHMITPVRANKNAAPGESRAIHAWAKAGRAHIPDAYKGWLSTSIPTLPEMLKSSGYATYMTGKWHLAVRESDTWPIQRGFDRFYGHLAGGSDFFDPKNLYRDNSPILPKGDRYYLTDAISDEAIGFLNDHDEAKDKDPFFLYLAYNAPHFPLHCMPEDYEKYRGRFKEGWDVLRKKKIEKQIKMGLIPANTKLAPRPTTDGKKMGDRGAAVPAWASLDEKKKDEMDAIMATYAAMIDRVDQNVGEVVKHLKETGELENTLIFFLTDNGGEAESGPFGQFKFENLGQYGKGGFKYGRSWATLSNTPFRDYKHFGHQGGIQTPLIVHWPRGVKDELNGKILNQYGFLPDIVQTCLEVAGARRPTERNGKPVPESDGISLVKVLQGSLGPVHTKPICIEHEGNRVVRQGKWKLVSYFDEPWELYDIEADRSESTDLAGAFTAVVDRLDAAYMAFATRAGVIPWEEALEYSVYKN